MATPHAHPTIGEYMTTDPMTADHELSIHDAQDRMMHNNLRHLVVVQGERVVGVVSSRDLGLALTIPGTRGNELTIADAMTRDPYCCVAQTPLVEAARSMEAHRYGCALVIDDDMVVGIFTTVDALRALRAVVMGELVEPANPPTHRLPAPEQRERVEHWVSASLSLGAGVRPSPNQGRIG